MRINTKPTKTSISPPATGEALVLQNRRTEEKFLVIRVPTTHGVGVAFVSTHVNYVQEYGFSEYAEKYFVEVARGPLGDVEVTFNA